MDAYQNKAIHCAVKCKVFLKFSVSVKPMKEQIPSLKSNWCFHLSFSWENFNSNDLISYKLNITMFHKQPFLVRPLPDFSIIKKNVLISLKKKEFPLGEDI